MLPEAQLAIVAAFAGFILKTFLGFCICWALGRIVASPHRTFLVWFAFLAVCGCYWLFLIGSFIPHAAPEFALPVHAATSSGPVAKWQFPSSWAYPLRMVERLLGGLYLIVLVYFLMARLKKQLRLRWVLRFAYKAPERIESMFRSIATESGAGKIELLVLSGIYSPATFGWIHPIVLLPPLCLEQDESELADILRHEMQHVARHDFFFHNVAGLCRALLFFHPALWYAMRRMELESELACDLAVVRNSPERRATYAECLVRFARLHAAQDPTPWNLDFAGSSIHLKVRVRSVLKETTKKVPGWLLGLRSSMGLLLFAAFLCVVPSCSIVLSYAHWIADPAASSLISSQPRIRHRKQSLIRRRERKDRVRAVSGPAAGIAAPANQVEAPLAAPPSALHQPDTLASGEPAPILQQRGKVGGRTPGKPAEATVFSISSPSSVNAGNRRVTKARSIASAFATGAGGAVRFVASHGKDIH